MEIFVDENKGDKNSFYLLSYVYGEAKDIDAFNVAVDLVKQKHASKLGNSFKGIHANKIKSPTMKAYVQDVLNVFKNFVSKNQLHYFIIIQSIAKQINNFGTIQNYLNSILTTIAPQFPDLQPQDKPNITNSSAQLWGMLQYPEKFKSTTNANVYVDSVGAILNYQKQNRTIIDKNGRSKIIPFYDLIKIFLRATAPVVANNFSKKAISIDKYSALSDTSSYVLQICDILANYLFNAIRAEKGNTNANIIYKRNEIINLLGIQPADLTSLASNFNNSATCTNNNAFMMFED